MDGVVFMCIQFVRLALIRISLYYCEQPHYLHVRHDMTGMKISHVRRHCPR